MAHEALIAVFIDFENLALGIREGERDDFRIDVVLKRLLEKGRIVFKRAYCDWTRFRGATRNLHAHGVGLVDIPQSKMSGKNSADIHMVVDALDLAHAKEHIDVFVLVSGDSDFSPLVSKLKENNKRVIGVGVKSSTSILLRDGCDEFIYYDDLVRDADATPKLFRSLRSRRERDKDGGGGTTVPVAAEPAAPERSATEAAPATPAPSRTRGRARAADKAEPAAAKAPESTPSKNAGAPAREAAPGDEGKAYLRNRDRQEEGLAKLVHIVRSLSRDYDPVWGSMVKQAIRRVYPEFTEEQYGYPSFVALLEDAAARDYLDLFYDAERGNYRVRLQPD